MVDEPAGSYSKQWEMIKKLPDLFSPFSGLGFSTAGRFNVWRRRREHPFTT
jgi:hypothetical protein